MKHIEGKFTGAGNLELYYQAWQADSAPKAVIALVHGFGEHGGRYRYLVNNLVPRDFTIYSFDLRGHGRSPGQRGYVNAWTEYRDDVRAFLKLVQTQEPGKTLFLYGQSLGGLMALEYGIHYTDGLKGVIVSAPLLAQAGISPLLVTLSRILSRIMPTFSLDTKLDASTISRDPAEANAYKTDPLVHSLGTARLGTELNAAMAWTHAHAAEWKLPLLIVHGDGDRLVPITGSQQFFDHVTAPDKTYITYPGGYHESHNDTHREQVFDDFAQWIEKHL